MVLGMSSLVRVGPAPKVYLLESEVFVLKPFNSIQRNAMVAPLKGFGALATGEIGVYVYTTPNAFSRVLAADDFSLVSVKCDPSNYRELSLDEMPDELQRGIGRLRREDVIRLQEQGFVDVDYLYSDDLFCRVKVPRIRVSMGEVCLAEKDLPVLMGVSGCDDPKLYDSSRRARRLSRKDKLVHDFIESFLSRNSRWPRFKELLIFLESNSQNQGSIESCVISVGDVLVEWENDKGEIKQISLRSLKSQLSSIISDLKKDFN